MVAGMALAQCGSGTSGTNCNSPLNVSGSTAAQSSVLLTDNGADPPAPAPSQYWLSVSSGTIRLSANGQPYLLPGMPTNYVLTAQAGAAFSQSVAAGVIGYSPALTQIDMTLPQQVRLVVSNSASTPSCKVQAQYYDGTSWVNLTNTVVLSGAVYTRRRGHLCQALPTGTIRSGWQSATQEPVQQVWLFAPRCCNLGEFNERLKQSARVLIARKHPRLRPSAIWRARNPGSALSSPRFDSPLFKARA
jgi:hypothetical protein